MPRWGFFVKCTLAYLFNYIGVRRTQVWSFRVFATQHLGLSRDRQTSTGQAGINGTDRHRVFATQHLGLSRDRQASTGQTGINGTDRHRVFAPQHLGLSRDRQASTGQAGINGTDRHRVFATPYLGMSLIPDKPLIRLLRSVRQRTGAVNNT